jgi:hypothetical protein
MADRCVCGRWFQNRAKPFGHAAHCDHYKRFREWYTWMKESDPALIWSEARALWIEEYLN